MRGSSNSDIPPPIAHHNGKSSCIVWYCWQELIDPACILYMHHDWINQQWYNVPNTIWQLDFYNIQKFKRGVQQISTWQQHSCCFFHIVWLTGMGKPFILLKDEIYHQVHKTFWHNCVQFLLLFHIVCPLPLNTIFTFGILQLVHRKSHSHAYSSIRFCCCSILFGLQE